MYKLFNVVLFFSPNCSVIPYKNSLYVFLSIKGRPEEAPFMPLKKTSYFYKNAMEARK